MMHSLSMRTRQSGSTLVLTNLNFGRTAVSLKPDVYCVYCKRYTSLLKARLIGEHRYCCVPGEPKYFRTVNSVTGAVSHNWNRERQENPTTVKRLGKCIPVLTLRGKIRKWRGKEIGKDSYPPPNENTGV
jgi:hypothetical protein